MTRRSQDGKPISQKTQHLLDGMARKRETREVRDRILIVCEDDKSAPNYFNALKRELSLTAASVRVVGSGGRTQPVQVAKQAMQMRELSASDNSGTEPFKYVWCVVDGDYGAKKIDEARSECSEGVEIVVSNKCFEYWLLLHYEEYDRAENGCGDYINKLKKHVKNYNKGSYNFAEMIPRHSIAAERAKKLRKAGLARNDPPEVQNPCSEIYKIIDKVKNNMVKV